MIIVTDLDFDGFEWVTKSDVRMIPAALDSSVALECAVLDTKPPPSIKWYQDDWEEIQEITQDNSVRFLDDRRYLYFKSLQASHFEMQYYCTVTNANLSQEISAPTRYILIDNLTPGHLVDYKQIGDLRAFVGNESFEFAYVGGVFGNRSNGTINKLSWNQTNEVPTLGNIGTIDVISSPGKFTLKAIVDYNGLLITRNGTLTVNREFIIALCMAIEYQS